MLGLAVEPMLRRLELWDPRFKLLGTIGVTQERTPPLCCTQGLLSGLWDPKEGWMPSLESSGMETAQLPA